MIRRSFLMLVGSAVLLSACGFKLRGQQDYAFKRLYIAGAPPGAGPGAQACAATPGEGDARPV